MTITWPGCASAGCGNGTDRRNLLLLDLDGVVVFEAGPPLVATREVLLLHQDLTASLSTLAIPVVILTHRSRREARRILQAAGLVPPAIAGVVAAEDLFIAGARHAPTRMFGRGLRKDLALPVLERRFGVPRSRVAFIDDRLDNLDDLRRAGLGLAIHAPFFLAAEGCILRSFDLADALGAIRDWQAGTRADGMVELPPRDFLLAPWCCTGISTATQGRHLFNAMRGLGRAVRLRAAQPSPRQG